MGRLSINLCDCSWFASPPGPSLSLLIRTKRYTSPCTFPSYARTQLPCPPPPGDLDHTPAHATRLPAGVLGYFSLASCWSFFSPGIRGVVTGLSGYVALHTGVVYRVHSTFVPLIGQGASFLSGFHFLFPAIQFAFSAVTIYTALLWKLWVPLPNLDIPLTLSPPDTSIDTT